MNRLAEALGIPQYQRRELKAEPALIHSYGNVQNPVRVFVFQNVSDKPDWTLPEWNLLQKIMAAVKLTENEIAFYWSSEPFTLPAQHSMSRGIIFGENWPGWIPTGLIQTVKIEDLLQNVAAKRLLWEQLKKW